VARRASTVEMSASGRAPSSSGLKIGATPPVALNSASVADAVIAQPWLAAWQVSQVRSLMPRRWKNGFVRSMTPDVWNVSAVPAGLGAASSALDVASVSACSTPQPATASTVTIARTLDDLDDLDLDMCDLLAVVVRSGAVPRNAPSRSHGAGGAASG
jgi:hypothetical protein